MLSLYLFYDNLGLLYSKRNACMHIMLFSIVGNVSVFCNFSHKGHPPGDKRLVGCFSDLTLELSIVFFCKSCVQIKVLRLEQLTKFGEVIFCFFLIFSLQYPQTKSTLTCG